MSKDGKIYQQNMMVAEADFILFGVKKGTDFVFEIRRDGQIIHNGKLIAFDKDVSHGIVTNQAIVGIVAPGIVSGTAPAKGEWNMPEDSKESPFKPNEGSPELKENPVGGHPTTTVAENVTKEPAPAEEKPAEKTLPDNKYDARHLSAEDQAKVKEKTEVPGEPDNA